MLAETPVFFYVGVNQLRTNIREYSRTVEGGDQIFVEGGDQIFKVATIYS